jgi:flagellar hook protein FlgE
MTRALLAAVGGLRAHQQWMDVIGDNLANANTNGFKGSRALFASLLSQTFTFGSPPTNSLGGTNPSQIGLGTQMNRVDRDMRQGSISYTGRPFDLAIAGNGYFAVTDGTQQLYTRNGAFGLDANSNLVDVRTGYRVLDSDGLPVTIDTQATIEPQATSEVVFSGNLPAEVGGPLAEVLASGAALEEGTAAQLTGSAAGPYTIPAGQTFELEISVSGGSPRTVQITGTGAPVAAQTIADEINAQVPGISASVVGGALQLTTTKVGKAATILVSNGPSTTNLAALTGLSTSLISGQQSQATGSSQLNDLVINDADYQVGDQIGISGTDAAGNQVTGTFTYGTDGTTLNDLVARINALFPDATASFDPGTGKIELTADDKGEAELSLVLLDEAGQPGASNWAYTAFNVAEEGTGPDTVSTSIQVYDSLGIAHLLNFEFERLEDGGWGVTAALPEDDGTVFSGQIEGLNFNTNGELPGQVNVALQVQFGDLPPTELTLSLGGNSEFSGITQYGGSSSVLAENQNGYGAGELANLNVNELGEIVGVYSNGQDVVLGEFGVATFANDRGLIDSGNSYYAESQNSGQPRFGEGSGAGDVLGGALEASNVDSAEEFVRLILAQRGFQASARLINIQDQMLEEANNII